MTPTTAALMAASGAVNRRSPRVASTSGAPAKMNTKDGRKVKKVTTRAATTPAASGDARNGCCQPPRKPTKLTTMMSGPGVDSPSAMPASICGALSQPYCSTAPCTTKGNTA